MENKEIGINDLDFNEDDYGISNPNEPKDNNVSKDNEGDPIKPWVSNPSDNFNNNLDSNPNNNEPTEDIITTLLKDKNILDKNKIKFEDDEGNIEEKSWDSLTREEQLNILRTSDNDSEDLEEDEISLINQLRLHQMSPQEFIDYVKQQGATEYAQTLQQEPTYKIDDLNDDELFILDLQSRIEDITDEEAKIALDRAKQDQALFEKQIKGIREEYKRIEDEKNQMDLLEKQQEQSQEFEEFKGLILDSIQDFNKIGQLDIDMGEDDMNEIANFILSSDSAGVNYLSKALNDPQTLVRMAWFALKGEEAIDSITKYFTEEIKKVSQSRYEQGLKDGRSGKKQTKEPPTVVINNTPRTFNKPTEISINELD